MSFFIFRASIIYLKNFPGEVSHVSLVRPLTKCPNQSVFFFVCLRVDGVMDAQGFERSYTVNSSILLAIQPHLVHFHQLLLEPPKVYKQRYNHM